MNLKFLIPTTLTLVAFVMVLWILFFSNGGFSTITMPLPAHVSSQQLLKGKVITKVFTATKNNLGIINIRFDSIPLVPYSQEDTLAFTIREAQNSRTLSKTTYKTDDMHNTPFFPFGFPIQSDSKNKTYIFSLTSLSGNVGNAVTISSSQPTFAAQYVSSLSKDPRTLITFLFQKIIVAVRNPNMFLFPKQPFALYVFVEALLLLAAFIHRGKYLFLVGIMFAILCAVFFDLRVWYVAEDLANWTYVFVLAGVVNEIWLKNI